MSVTAAKGFRAAGVRAGLKASGKPDLALVVNDGPLDVAAGVFTTNRVVAAPVTWSRRAVADGHARAVILNSGSANACTGTRGADDAAATAAQVAHLLSTAQMGSSQAVTACDVLVCSTGVIGEPLDMERVLEGAGAAARALAATPAAGHDAATAIMTTDTVSKEDALTLTHEDSKATWTVGGMIKGVGMLAPGMATMLCVLTTDAVVEVLGRLGRRLVADAEGATHDIAITVTGAVSEEAAELAARTVSASNLLKCAVAGEDPNWGRVLSQLGAVPERLCPFNPDEVDVTINGVTIFRHGGLGEDRSLVDMTPRETRIDIALHAGEAQATVWTNDLTHGYVTINADYTT